MMRFIHWLVPALLLGLLAAGDEPVRLMGYERLDAAGAPQGIVVAVPRSGFDALWARAHGPVTAAELPVAVAIGTPAITLSLVGNAIAGRLDLPVMVPGRSWQELRVPLPGPVRTFEALPLASSGTVPAGRVTWRAEQGQLVLSLEGGQQALLRIDFTMPTNEVAGGRRASLQLPPGLGGRLQLVAPEPWRGVAGPLVLVAGSADLPTTLGTLELGWDLPTGAIQAGGRLSVEQRIVVRLEPGRIDWTAELDLASAGAPQDGLRFLPPVGVVLAEVAGDGVASWRREGATVVVAWTEPAAARQLHLAGVVSRGGDGSEAGRMAVAVTVPGAAVSRGRLGLGTAAGERFLRPEGVALSSAEPADGEALAVRWDDQPAGLSVAWEGAPRDLTLHRDVAVVIGEGRARCSAAVTVAGKGASDALHLSLPEPWRVAAIEGAVSWAVSGEAAARELVLTAAVPWGAGGAAVVQLEADRIALGVDPALPLLEPHGIGLRAGRLRLAIADAGATRAHLDAGASRALPPEQVAQDLSRLAGLRLAPGERWRVAAEVLAAQRPALHLSTEEAVATASLSHYLILGRDGVRWSLHLTATPEQGALPGLALQLPDGARLVAVSGPGLGRWQLDGGMLRLAWAAATASTAAVDLELDLPAAADGSVRLTAPQIADWRSVQQVALVEEDDLGLVHREPDGLGELEQPIARLPDGVQRSQVRWLWKATRSDWSLRLAREPLAVTAGADGLATLVDGVVTVAPDGEQRGVATWHIVNRTRQQLPLRLPAGVELWESRVDGQAVRVRRDQSGALWLPVPPLRPGQASTRVGLVWRAAPAVGGRIRMAPPVIAELKLITSAWRVAAPAGWHLSRHDGALVEADPADAAADRAQAVIDEIQRLQAVDGLSEQGLRRLEGQLAVLDSELKDHLASLGRRSDELRQASRPSSAGFSKISSTTQAITDNGRRLGEMQKEISGNYGNRSNRRKQLNLGALNQSWNRADAVHEQSAPPRRSARDEPQRPLLASWPWDDALVAGGSGGLGAGQAPPGLINGTGTTLTGIELVEEPSGDVLVLRGQGASLEAELILTPQGGAWLPWLAVVLAGVVLALGGTLLCRRLV